MEMKNVMIALALTGAALTPAAFAEDQFPLVFEYDRAELQTAEGAQGVYDRLVAEIETACAASKTASSMTRARYQTECISAALEEASDIIASRSGQSLAQVASN